MSRFWDGQRVVLALCCGCTLAGLASGYLYSQGRITHASQRAIAQADSLERSIAESSVVYMQRLHEDSLIHARDADRLARARSLQRQASQVGVLAARLSDTIRVSLPDTLLPLFERLGAFHERQVAGLTGAIKLRDSVIVDLNRRVAFRDSILQGVRSQLEAAMQQLGRALAAGRPRRCGLGATLGYGAVSSGGAVRMGPGASAGLSCRL